MSQNPEPCKSHASICHHTTTIHWHTHEHEANIARWRLSNQSCSSPALFSRTSSSMKHRIQRYMSIFLFVKKQDLWSVAQSLISWFPAKEMQIITLHSKTVITANNGRRVENVDRKFEKKHIFFKGIKQCTNKQVSGNNRNHRCAPQVKAVRQSAWHALSSTPLDRWASAAVAASVATPATDPVCAPTFATSMAFVEPRLQTACSSSSVPPAQSVRYEII